MILRRALLPILLCACGPGIVSVSDDTTTAVSVDDGDDDDGTFGGTVPDPTATTMTSNDVTTEGPHDTGSPDETTTTDDEPNDFSMPPDHGGLPVECDIWADDCPPGTKCMPWANDGGSAWNATKCTPLAEDPRDVGESCTVEENGVSGIDDCGPRSMCWNVDPETLMGECAAFCSGSEANPTCDDPCATCHIPGDGVLILCLPVCAPLAQDCGEGQACYPVNQSYTCAPDASDDAGAIGEACEFINVCDPGLFCAPAELVPGCEGASGCCAPFCNVLAEDPCAALPGGVECVPWDDEVEKGCGSGLVGGCLLPE